MFLSCKESKAVLLPSKYSLHELHFTFVFGHVVGFWIPSPEP